MGIEKLTTLAFSMYSNKGAYALLLGSGVSRSANIPSGWEVEEELIKKLGAIKDIKDQANWHNWYKETYQQSASYSSLLGEIVNTPTERVQLMKSFFEPSEEERRLDQKVPTKAHIAIAKLTKKGYVRVILTTNFDRLLEQAFAKEGVTPQVISHEGAIAQATPITHSKIPTIIKINGDYIDCQFRNTTEELDEYPEQMELYLSRIFEDFGLVTCGWSGDWDKGLIKIINSTKRPRYNSFFASVGETSDSIKLLSQNRLGEVMPIESADNLFSELYEQVMALEKYDVNTNLSHEMMMARSKKYLSSKQYDIEFADLIEKWGIEAYNQITEVAHYDFQLTQSSFNSYLEIHIRAISPLLYAAILTARWGTESQIKLFGDILVKLCILPRSNREVTNEETKYLHSLAPMLLLNTIGIACVKYERFRELNNILNLSVPAGNFRGLDREPLLGLLGETHWSYDTWNNLIGSNYYYPISIFLLQKLKLYLKDYFVTDSEYENTFYIWEHLKSLVYGYKECFLTVFYVPTGNFLRKRWNYEVRHNGQEPYSLFFKEADLLKNNWEPIKQGMFGGSYDEYKKIYDKAEEYYKKNIKC